MVLVWLEGSENLGESKRGDRVVVKNKSMDAFHVRFAATRAGLVGHRGPASKGIFLGRAGARLGEERRDLRFDQAGPDVLRMLEQCELHEWTSWVSQVRGACQQATIAARSGYGTLDTLLRTQVKERSAAPNSH